MASNLISSVKNSCTLLFCLFITVVSYTQTIQKKKLDVFFDCSNSYCDMTFIKTEINFVNYVFDFKAADVHVLITQQNTGGGGSQFQMIFYGQHDFKDQLDTIRFDTKPNSTEFEIRDLQIKYLRLGLVPYLVKTTGIENINIELKQSVTGDSLAKADPTKDPWNYWVFNINANGSINSDQVYNSFRYSGDLSATQITEQLKIRFNFNARKNKNSYEYSDSSGISKIEVINNTYSFTHQIVKSLSDHWSVGYDVDIFSSTFTNYKFRTVLKPAIEYNFFPYKMVNNKLFTIRYGIDLARNVYFYRTVLEKKKETLLGQGLETNLTYNQKWGTINISASAHSYFHNPKFFNVGVGGGVNVRVTGNLAFNVFVFGSYQKDQLYLPKGNVTIQQVLTRQRQLATNFNYFTFFGVSYRFGSKMNNFVNPRFPGSGGGNFFFN